MVGACLCRHAQQAGSCVAVPPCHAHLRWLVRFDGLFKNFLDEPKVMSSTFWIACVTELKIYLFFSLFAHTKYLLRWDSLH